jgi:AbrB family looped-hinge helix DNA binding protein
MTGAARMKKLTEGLPSKSEKMRALAKAGYSRGEISRFLGTSYQFVRNVLVRDEERASAHQPTADVESVRVDDAAKRDSNRVCVGAGGEIVLPAALLKALDIKSGETLVVIADDGEIRLMPIATAVRKAQAIVRRYVPEGVSLVDELLEDRRREVEREVHE